MSIFFEEILTADAIAMCVKNNLTCRRYIFQKQSKTAEPITTSLFFKEQS